MISCNNLKAKLSKKIALSTFPTLHDHYNHVQHTRHCIAVVAAASAMIIISITISDLLIYMNDVYSCTWSQVCL